MPWLMLSVAVVAALLAACVPPTRALAPPAFRRLPTGSVTPKSWLLEQLRLQAEGLGGHLAQFWPDVMDSAWRGGKGDRGLHERTPYWLNGFVPLAYLLRNANVTELPGVFGLYHQRRPCASLARPAADCKDLPPVRPMEQVKDYVQEILKRKGSSGWLGPDDQTDGNMYWAASVAMLALVQFAEAEPSASDEVEAAILGHLLEMRRRLSKVHLSAVAQARWVDVAYAAVWMLERPGAPAGHESDLEDLLRLIREQGEDWDGEFAHPVTRLAGRHNVDTAEGLKSAAVEYLASSGSDPAHYLAMSRQRRDNLDRYFGVPTGAFVGDELLPNTPLRYPSRGSELCQIVEAMFSYGFMFAVHGDVSFADRAERLAYNALPATWASPRGGDMWAHQYLQAVNEINAIKAIPHIWPNDGEFAETYGLSPNYGCCTANFNQGWPKFASNLFYTVDRPGEEGIAIALWAPASASTPYGEIDVETTYPFGDSATVTVRSAKATRVYVRIPAWAVDAEIPSLGVRPQNGSMASLAVPAGGLQFELLFRPRIRLEAGGSVVEGADGNTSYSVHRGALMYSLPLGLNYTAKETYIPDEGPWSIPGHSDYEVRPTTPWAYALDADPSAPSKTLTFEARGYSQPAAPFNQTGWPCAIRATVRPLAATAWRELNNSAAPPPASPACVGAAAAQCGRPQEMLLAPHGATVLRVGSLPLSGLSRGQDRARSASDGEQFLVI